jgi:hypothetical protein
MKIYVLAYKHVIQNAKKFPFLSASLSLRDKKPAPVHDKKQNTSIYRHGNRYSQGIVIPA